MSKRNPTNKRSDGAQGTDSEASEARTMLVRTRRMLEALLAAAEVSIAGGVADAGLMREAAGCSRAVIALAAELRLRDQQQQAQRRAITVQVVVEWARGLPFVERQQLAQMITELVDDENRSVLS